MRNKLLRAGGGNQPARRRRRRQSAGRRRQNARSASPPAPPPRPPKDRPRRRQGAHRAGRRAASPARPAASRHRRGPDSPQRPATARSASRAAWRCPAPRRRCRLRRRAIRGAGWSPAAARSRRPRVGARRLGLREVEQSRDDQRELHAEKGGRRRIECSTRPATPLGHRAAARRTRKNVAKCLAAAGRPRYSRRDACSAVGGLFGTALAQNGMVELEARNFVPYTQASLVLRKPARLTLGHQDVDRDVPAVPGHHSGDRNGSAAIFPSADVERDGRRPEHAGRAHRRQPGPEAADPANGVDSSAPARSPQPTSSRPTLRSITWIPRPACSPSSTVRSSCSPPQASRWPSARFGPTAGAATRRAAITFATRSARGKRSSRSRSSPTSAIRTWCWSRPRRSSTRTGTWSRSLPAASA